MKSFIFISFLLLRVISQAQINSACEIMNCGNENRISSYAMVVSSIMLSILDTSDIRRNKNIKYSAASPINGDSVYKKIVKAKKSIPKGFKLTRFGFGTSVKNNKPNEDGSIWFTVVLSEEESKNNFIPYVGYTVIFEGTDPTAARIDPTVKDVIIISDRNLLKEFITRFKALPE